ncbi:hypothetical protein DFH11DRAFT_739217 [Phellopilus nigrolimitatus]|nr:hypothetical protein DFH11DRAFT_739217 [Phellopilus nigrolimitatus]
MRARTSSTCRCSTRSRTCRARTRTASRFPCARVRCPHSPPRPLLSFASSSPTVAGDGGYELCPGCCETAGVLRALAGGGVPSESPSSEDQCTLNHLRRAVPGQKGHFRHAYLKKLWSASRWKDVKQDNMGECIICNTSLTK